MQTYYYFILRGGVRRGSGEYGRIMLKDISFPSKDKLNESELMFVVVSSWNISVLQTETC